MCAVLYYDFNIASEATTTTPFTHMDMSVYCESMGILFNAKPDLVLFSENPNMLMFNGGCRQFVNVSHSLKFTSREGFAKELQTLDTCTCLCALSTPTPHETHGQQGCVSVGSSIADPFWSSERVESVCAHAPVSL